MSKYVIPGVGEVAPETYAVYMAEYGGNEKATAPRVAAVSAPSKHEERFVAHWVIIHPGEALEAQHRFTTARKFALDFYHAKSRVGIEIQGGTSQRPVKVSGKWMIPVSGHNSMAGINRDCEKLLLAATHGIITLCVTETMLRDDSIVFTIDQIWRVIKGRMNAI